MTGISDKSFYNWVTIATLIPILFYINYPGKTVAVSIMSNGLILYLLVKRYRIGKLTHLSSIIPLNCLFYVMLFGIAKSFFFPKTDDIEIKDLIISLFGIVPLFLALAEASSFLAWTSFLA